MKKLPLNISDVTLNMLIKTTHNFNRPILSCICVNLNMLNITTYNFNTDFKFKNTVSSYTLSSLEYSKINKQINKNKIKIKNREP